MAKIRNTRLLVNQVTEAITCTGKKIQVSIAWDSYANYELAPGQPFWSYGSTYVILINNIRYSFNLSFVGVAFGGGYIITPTNPYLLDIPNPNREPTEIKAQFLIQEPSLGGYPITDATAFLRAFCVNVVEIDF